MDLITERTLIIADLPANLWRRSSRLWMKLLTWIRDLRIVHSTRPCRQVVSLSRPLQWLWFAPRASTMPLTFSRRSEGSTSRNEYHFLSTSLGVPSLMLCLRDYGRMSNFSVQILRPTGRGDCRRVSIASWGTKETDQIPPHHDSKV